MKNAVQYSITTNVSGNAAERPPSQTPGAFPVFHGADILRPAEDLRKIAQGGKSQKLRDMGQRKIGLCQQIFALFDPPGRHVINGGDTVFPFESVG